MTYRVTDQFGLIYELRDPIIVHTEMAWGDCLRGPYRVEGDEVWQEAGDFEISKCRFEPQLLGAVFEAVAA